MRIIETLKNSGIFESPQKRREQVIKNLERAVEQSQLLSEKVKALADDLEKHPSVQEAITEGLLDQETKTI